MFQSSKASKIQVQHFNTKSFSETTEHSCYKYKWFQYVETSQTDLFESDLLRVLYVLKMVYPSSKIKVPKGAKNQEIMKIEVSGSLIRKDWICPVPREAE